MSLGKAPSRRQLLKAGISAMAPTLIVLSESGVVIRPKAQGETQVVYLGGDFWHDGIDR